MVGRWKDTLLRSLLLFFISNVIVAGFWFHQEFYRLGLVPLLVLGGFMVFLVIMVTRSILSGALPRRRAREELVLSVAEADAIPHRAEGVVIAPAAPDLPHLGAVVRIVTEGGALYGTMRVVNAHRTLLGDLTQEDIQCAGYANPSAFRKSWQARRPWLAEEPVTVISLAHLGGSPR